MKDIIFQTCLFLLIDYVSNLQWLTDFKADFHVIQFSQMSVSEEIHSTGEILPQVSWEESTVSETKINLGFISRKWKQTF